MTFYSCSSYVSLDVFNSGSLADLGLILSQTNGPFLVTRFRFKLTELKLNVTIIQPIILAQIFSFKIAVRRITINNVIYNHFILYAILIRYFFFDNQKPKPKFRWLYIKTFPSYANAYAEKHSRKSHLRKNSTES